MLLIAYFAKKARVNTIFQISSSEKTEEDVLLCEWGAAHCCIAWYNEALKTLSDLHYVSFDLLDEPMVENLLEALSQRAPRAKQMVICSSFPQAVLTPAKLYNRDSNLISNLFGRRFSPQFSDAVNEWQLINVFAFPNNIGAAITKRFPSATVTHVHTPELKIYNGFVAENQVVVHFTPKHFRVTVKQSGQLQLAQIYFYSAPLDVVYYLLKIVEELNLDKEDTTLILAGLIDQESPLYKEIESYFLNVHFAKASTISLSGNDQPQHFFTSLYNLAACVS